MILDKDFGLTNDYSRRLYWEFAESLPIYDYHGHLPVKQIADNHTFANLTEIWLDGDHYKWRAMRAAGVEEHFITGDALPYEKFLAWVRVMPLTLRNPLFLWSHLELQRTFGITHPINEANAERIWHEAGEQLPSMPVSAILDRYQVALIGTTDDPLDSLDHHMALRGNRTTVVPTFRPDRLFRVDDPVAFQAEIQRWRDVTGRKIERFEDLCEAISLRHSLFQDAGGRISDHGLLRAPRVFPKATHLNSLLNDVFDDEALSPDDTELWIGGLMQYLNRLDRTRGWVKQLHLGPLRNPNRLAMTWLGPDTGFDAMGDKSQVWPLSQYLSHLDENGELPKTIIYSINPADNEPLSALLASFPEEGVPGKLQLGSAWWFNDHRRGIENHLESLSNNSLLGLFVGMLTDSRSFLSFPRHEVFRRTLCDMLGRDMARGELPTDFDLVGTLVRDLCWNNALLYFDIGLHPDYDFPR